LVLGKKGGTLIETPASLGKVPARGNTKKERKADEKYSGGIKLGTGTNCYGSVNGWNKGFVL